MQRIQGLSLLTLTALLAACASTGATFRSGVGDTLLEHPPYYAGVPMEDVARDTSVVAHFAVTYQPGSTKPAGFDPKAGAGTAIQALLADMSAYLDSLGVSTRLTVAEPAPATASKLIAPDVRFGCIPEFGVPGNDCAPRGDSALGRSPQQMQLTVGRPSPEWTTWTNEALTRSTANRALVITLEVGDYLTRQEGLAGTKVLELGTGHKARLPWLTSLETPVSVLQLTASLVDRNGKSIRIGAEGIYARRTRLTVSAFGAQELLSSEDVAAARTARRTDLPGQPIAWQVAMRELVGRVTGREVRIPRLASY